jgi:hypothetical protein
MDLFKSDLPPGIESAITAIEKRFLLMRSSGSSIRDIAKTLNKSNTTICSWNKKFAKELIGIRNTEFCDLQKKVIESKTLRLNFIIGEFERISKLLKKHKMDVNEAYGGYNKYLELFVKLSDLMSACESDILTVGVKFKDNIEPEIYQCENDAANNDDCLNADKNPVVTKTVTDVTPNHVPEITDNTELKIGKEQIGTKCNTVTPKKYETYKKHKLK